MGLSRIQNNILKKTDSYKVTHWLAYEDDIEVVYSYLEGRIDGDKTLFYGLQYILMEYLEGQVVTKEMIDEAEQFFKLHFSGDYFNREGWEYILEKYGGKLPLKIKAVPEGSIVDTHNVLMVVENTDPKCFWLTNYVETILMQVWYPITVATYSWKIRQLILKALEETGDPTLINFKLHDFGYRGSTSDESAGIGGSAHLVNFMGTDTLVALDVAKEYYFEPMAGFSIPATEHSIMTTSGREGELGIMRRYIEKFPKGIIAMVCDQFDVFKVCSEYLGKELKCKILGRDGTLVIRPDSGDPIEVLSRIFNILWERFGGKVNPKGYMVLDSHVRVIQGDGVNYDTIYAILQMMKEKGFSADNITFGSGGALLQKHDRDEYSMAFKCCAVRKNDTWFDVFKEPITSKAKNSKKGRLALVKEGNTYRTVPEYYTRKRLILDLTKNTGHPSAKNELVTVFENGVIKRTYTFKEIRERTQGLID